MGHVFILRAISPRKMLDFHKVSPRHYAILTKFATFYKIFTNIFAPKFLKWDMFLFRKVFHHAK